MIKKFGKTEFNFYDRAICAIHELILYVICCGLGKMLRCFWQKFDFCYSVFYNVHDCGEQRDIM